MKGLPLAQAPESEAPKKRPAAAPKLDVFDVSALERSLNDSATHVSTIWVSFLFFSLYLLIAATAVTHRQLLLAEPLKLPVLDISLPLWGFFFLAPILFVILHVYVLLQVLLLARTAAVYNAAVERANLPPEENAALRQRLANTLFAQIFAGSPREREGWLGWLLKAMAWITLAIAPVLILLVFQFAFLPYHSHLVTWIHRFLIAAELAAAFVLWPLVLDARRDFEWTKIWMQVKRTMALPLQLSGPNDRRRDEWVRLRQQAVPLASCVLFVLVSLLLVTFPGEPHINLLTGQSLLSVQCERWVSSQFDRLYLLSVDVVEDEKFDKIESAATKRGEPPSAGERTQNFSGRDLNCGTFGLADLRRADFSEARMIGGIFYRAKLQGASLYRAQLQGAKLNAAELQGTDLSWAGLQDADLSRLQFFPATQLQGAVLLGTQLQGADLGNAQLQGANLQTANLRGANLKGAQLHGAFLGSAHFQGADLTFAELQGADLLGAELEGADLSGAQFQGADLGLSKLKLALFSDVFIWRTKRADCLDARTTNPKLDAAIELKAKFRQAEPVPATREAISDFIKRALADLSEPLKDQASNRLHAGLVADINKEDLAAIETKWRECAANSEKIERAEYDRQRADLLRDLVCDSTTYQTEIARGIFRDWQATDRHDFFTYLARGLLGLDGKECAATKDLSDRAKEFLRKFVSRPPPAK
ncbi:pentapeptide repeat-containing protein (plasmid) [Bradyrhizobium barranii subsp. barranii]|uniref:Pentapeptide repeat-containing protein n=1 Tax=Bradyrhizobium barranii subsp. barranii TaxID=2823807 RepID=A0A7Z0TXA8_9BRAD|nr:pentapeptide repeat-containing protein [Bradyrhizobium barranii]UGX89800.1 pentapeptide repeat-containing protein [Bradyrhizobium barranii subsp. barranii]